METREDLHDLIEKTTGRKAYFQPPENLTMVYPCTVYELNGLYPRHANNRNYVQRPYYQMTYITRDPEDPNIQKLADLPQCAMGRPFSSENLHHYPYTIYYGTRIS